MNSPPSIQNAVPFLVFGAPDIHDAEINVDPGTQNIDPAAIEATISPRARAIIPVSFAGRPCEMDATMRIATQHNLVIEDCAHAIRTECRDPGIGTLSEFDCFSFYATKKRRHRKKQPDPSRSAIRGS